MKKKNELIVVAYVNFPDGSRKPVTELNPEEKEQLAQHIISAAARVNGLEYSFVKKNDNE